MVHKYGYIDRDGNFAIEPIFLILLIRFEMALLHVIFEGKSRFIAVNGDTVLQTNYSFVGNFFIVVELYLRMEVNSDTWI
ncbi:hypothetical protein ACFTAO_40810 [Paenibacillus rhizoplanae]